MSQERTGTQIVHVRDNSSEELDALFSVAMNPADPGQSGQLPFRMRKLPASFFKPPEPQIHHSKEGSADSTGGYNPGNNVGNSNLQIAHMRSISSPASLQQTLSVAPPPLQQTHVRAVSDLSDEQPLPPGWEMARTPQGQRYFLNHLIQATTWTDPRRSLSTTALNNQASPPPSQQSPNVSLQNIGPLPHGWEQATTPDGEVYYINHIERTTSWFDPRLAGANMQQQRVQMRAPPNQGPPPPAGPQRQMQQPPQQSQQPDMQRQMQLQRLQMEKERLRKRQEEIARQEMLLRTNLQLQQQQQQQAGQTHQTTGETPVTQDIAISQASEMTSVTDPFLGQSGSSELHSRQESTDSGLGGMGTGTNCSLSRTPEDFLSNVDEMDTQDGGHRQDFNNMDIGNIGESGEPNSMDSEDLVPSLQEDISNELLNDVENVLNSNRMDNLLTWL